MDPMSTGWWTFVETVMHRERWTQAELARRARMDSSVVTGWKNGRQPSTENLRLFSEATGIPMLRLLVESGHLTDEEAGGLAPEMPEPEPIDVVAAIENDPQLLPEAKRHLTSQYGLLLRVTPRPESGATDRPAAPLRAVARKRPTKKNDD